MFSLRILSVDDDPLVPRCFARFMRNQTDLRLSSALSSKEALARLSEAHHDVAILDLCMESPLEGLELGRKIRERWPEMVVIILTGNSSMESAIEAVSIADGYMEKPLDPHKLLTKVYAAFLSRHLVFHATRNRYYPEMRDGQRQSHIIAKGPWRLDLLFRSVRVHLCEPVELTGTECAVLGLLLLSSPHPVSIPDLLRAFEKNGRVDGLRTSDSIRTHIKALRRKLEPDPGRPIYLITQRGKGYKLVTDDRVQN